MSDPYHDRKPIHLAKHMAPDGGVSPLCAKTPRALNLKVATWTLDRNAVTCPRCKKLLPAPALASSTQNGV